MKASIKLLSAAILILACRYIQGAPGENSPFRLTADRKLEFPADYREWIFLSSGKGMTYGPSADPHGPPQFDNVFVDPAAYKAFKQTGSWPERAIFVLEIREGRTEGSINKSGSFQGDVKALEVLVKDPQAFPQTKGWGFYEFNEGREPATPLGLKQGCFACHSANGAVELTFVQFYPTLKPIAAQHGTLRKGH